MSRELTSKLVRTTRIGGIIGFWINYGVSLNLPSGFSQWFTPFAVQLIPSCLFAIMIPLVVRESPRWLIQRGKRDRAIANLCYLRKLDPSHPYLIEEVNAITLQVETDVASIVRLEQPCYWLGNNLILSHSGRRLHGSYQGDLHELAPVPPITTDHDALHVAERHRYQVRHISSKLKHFIDMQFAALSTTTRPHSSALSVSSAQTLRYLLQAYSVSSSQSAPSSGLSGGSTSTAVAQSS